MRNSERAAANLSGVLSHALPLAIATPGAKCALTQRKLFVSKAEVALQKCITGHFALFPYTRALDSPGLVNLNRGGFHNLGIPTNAR